MWSRTDWFILAALLVVGALLVLPGLGESKLWTDEAQTAIVAANILRSGLPQASDGHNLVTLFSDHRDIRNGIYIWQPWLPNYLAAASMAVMGKDAFGARLPFALAFVLLIGVSYRVIRRQQPDRRLVLLYVVLMLGSIPLLLHARQSRYYLLVPLFNLLVVNAYLRWFADPKPIRLVALVCWFTLLFNSFFPGAPGLALALGIDLLRRRPDRRTIRAFALAAAAFLIINLPVALYCRVWARHGLGEPGYTGLAVFGTYLLRYVLSLNTFFFPLLLLVLACLWRWRELIARRWTANGFAVLSVIICAVQLVVFSLISDYPFTRYLIGITPFFSYLAAYSIWVLSGRKMLVAWSLVLVVSLTNLLHLLPLIPLRYTSLQQPEWTVAGVNWNYLDSTRLGESYARGEIKQIINTRPGSPLYDYAGSLLESPAGPIDRIVDYLLEEATPGERVKISYGDLPLIFHTDLEITSSADIGAPAPRWLIKRHFNPMQVDQHFIQNTADVGYSEIELDLPDLQWNNRPDPLYHFFEEPGADLAPPIKILKRKN